MAEFNLNRFKYTWKGEWQTGQTYNRDDVISIQGKSFVCLIQHVSSAAFFDDLYAILPGSVPPQPQPKWVAMTDGRTFVGDWQAGQNYLIDSIVNYQGNLYRVINAHTSTNFADDSLNFETFTANTSFVGDWAPSTTYARNNIIKYNGIVYKCAIAHNSQTFLEDDLDKWEEFFVGTEYVGNYTNGNTYRKNDLVKFGGTIFRCRETHVAESDILDANKFLVELLGYQREGTWSSSVVYNIGDVVQYGGFIYLAIQNSLNVEPFGNTVEWVVLAPSFNLRFRYSNTTSYKAGDVVQRGGNLYEAVQDITVAGDAGSNTNLNNFQDTNLWKPLFESKNFKGVWTRGTTYFVNDLVFFLGNIFRCTVEHIAEYIFVPNNGSGYNYWDLTATSGSVSGLENPGDLITFGISQSPYSDGSTLLPTALPIGTEEQVLSVNSSLEAYWRRFDTDSDTIFVGMHGVDDSRTHGFSIDKPFKTIRYAAEFVEENFTPLTPVKIQVSTGRYEEICPIIVPAGCAIKGDELRSVNVIANGPLPEYQNDWVYVQDYISRIEAIILDIVTNTAVTKTTGNNETQIFVTGGGSIAEANFVSDKFIEFTDYVEFRTISGSTDPVLQGTNTENTDPVVQGGALAIKENSRFIAEEVYAYLVQQYPAVSFTKDRIVADVMHLMNSISKDLRFGGLNYYTLQSAERYANAVTGSQLSNMFLLRDSTGLRNCTLQGLSGGLNPPGVFVLFQKPTAGAYCSLDPGWGAADSRTWINTRSPYVQNCTSLGFACVGVKVDGVLHNGGNKSMVANDFTQVVDDGIGVWVTNNARAELVSIFTYYNQIGYFAEDGGIIRSANGNNSYGTFGTVATGNDVTEVPQTATVNNRNNEAQVASVFPTNSNDAIGLFEYENAGENYTTASSSIVGAGSSVSTEHDEFRDQAIFNARLINTQGSGSEGGSGYVVKQSFAQSTPDATSTIILSTQDDTETEAEILGMRIIIVDGTGKGQYGYISAYNPSTKVLTVSSEETGSLGWDHIVPGTTLAASFDQTTKYRIEPRITVDHPGFTSTSSSLPNNRSFSDVTFGGITESYPGISVPLSTAGAAQELETVAATINVIRAGSVYSATIDSGGSGYVVGDSFEFNGSLFGGATPTNNMTITVQSTDASGTITNLSVSGTGRQGRYVAVAQPNFVVYSDNGITWTEGNLSSLGTWTKVVNGNNRFVAINNNTTTASAFSLSLNGTTWIDTGGTGQEDYGWTDIAYGNGVFVAVSDNINGVANSDTIAVNADGTGNTWSSVTVASDQWKLVSYGQGTFVAVAEGSTNVLTSTNGTSWSNNSTTLPTDKTWVGMDYGKNKFLLLASDGSTYYSLDKGVTWIQGATPDPEDDNTANWLNVKYGQGVFVALYAGQEPSTNYLATTETGLSWTARTVANTRSYTALTFSNYNNQHTWHLLGSNSTVGAVARINTGAKAILRSDVTVGRFQRVKIWDPGSGYATIPNLTVVDPNFDTEVEIDLRLSNGVNTQPAFVSRGSGYRAESTTVTITGDGFADIIPQSNELTLDGVSVIPGPGVQITIAGILNELTEDPNDLELFTGVEITDLGDDSSGNGTRTVRFTISPALENEYNLSHGTTVTLRERYSQCRISGHDFLDIGTGNFEATNYPDIYAQGNFFIASPENEVEEYDGGRVFYTSTDQDGNFRTGELFGVNQATGIVTISAEFFDLGGLTELRLGGVRLGGSGTVIREFSTDASFSEDSNNVIPTQRAIATFLADRLSVGGENLAVNKIQAGVTELGTVNNTIKIVDGSDLIFARTVDISGPDQNDFNSQISGTIVQNLLYYRRIDESMQ